jgi:hypothetical protein
MAKSEEEQKDVEAMVAVESLREIRGFADRPQDDS